MVSFSDDDVVESVLRRLKAGLQQPLSQELSVAQYQSLRAALDLEPEIKLRGSSWFLNDDHKSGIFTVSMPSPLHDQFTGNVLDHIHDCVHEIGRHADATKKSLVRSIKKRGGRIYTNVMTKEYKDPDAGFRFLGYKFPTVLLEVIYSHDIVPYDVAVRYFRVGAQVVIFLAIPYENPDTRATALTATSTVSRTYTCTAYRGSRVIRADNTEAVALTVIAEEETFAVWPAGGALTSMVGTLALKLSDFCPPNRVGAGTNTDVDIPLSYEALLPLLEDAYEMQKVEDDIVQSNDPDPDIIPPPKRKHSQMVTGSVFPEVLTPTGPNRRRLLREEAERAERTERAEVEEVNEEGEGDDGERVGGDAVDGEGVEGEGNGEE
ncbi:hypothetical protein K491DRAFT_699771 [Lophiostoma macrostomum CBS 122681]|uniref:Uncharacterized protein n=1 Tax=Lophiostoma macrostomum CBS 122681 TaxID=1314788 RepID=A0A6A6SH82_9PLEO|nr:hypothetical protein K491DRAFT_699771 [Lophiostoma macrostomum CBS 122681]